MKMRYIKKGKVVYALFLRVTFWYFESNSWMEDRLHACFAKRNIFVRQFR